MKPTLDVPPQALERWQRLALGIRLAYAPQQPVLIRRDLALGHLLFQQGQLQAHRAWPRMLELLLQTAADEALPWFWRTACLEYMAMPLARLPFQRRHHDDGMTGQLHERAEALGAQLALPPGMRQAA
jgi:hypothetical protein